MGHREEWRRMREEQKRRFASASSVALRIKSRAEVAADVRREKEERKQEAQKVLSKLISGPVYGDGDI